jgi:hypothetical protein
MLKQDGEISARKAAEILQRDTRTVRSWCNRSLEGSRSPLDYVRESGGLRRSYWLRESEVRSLARTINPNPDAER